jgi:SPP1 gp7 family putative phage head morphogenesis protein
LDALIEVRPAWLFGEERYQRLLHEVDRATVKFLHQATETTIKAKRAAVEHGETDAPRLTLARLGAAPADAQAAILSSFTKLPDQALARIIELAADEAPLGRLFAEIAPLQTQLLRDALAFGVAGGKSVQDIAREVMHAGNIPLTRALTITRTEVLRSYRQTTGQMYRQSNAVQGWEWLAELDDRTCPICWAEHGSYHQLGEDLDTHVNCRCIQFPVTVSWADLGFHGGPFAAADARRATTSLGSSLFERLPARSKLSILGPTRYGAYERGELRLEDIPRETASRFGRGLRQANLRELGLRQAA